MTLLSIVHKLPFAPPIFSDESMDKYGEQISLPQAIFPTPLFAAKLKNGRGRPRPQAIAHRGHKATYPENTLCAFQHAVEIGAHALETDVHLTKDGVVVLSHDPDLRRCFGVEKNIGDCDWNILESLRTIQAPHEPLARLSDLLKLFETREWQETWLMIDIKTDDDPEDMMQGLMNTFNRTGIDKETFWKERVVFCFWTAKYVELCDKYLPGFSILNIGFSIPYSRQFLNVPNASFNLLQASAVSPWGCKFIKEVQAQHRQIYT